MVRPVEVGLAAQALALALVALARLWRPTQAQEEVRGSGRGHRPGESRRRRPARRRWSGTRRPAREARRSRRRSAGQAAGRSAAVTRHLRDRQQGVDRQLGTAEPVPASAPGSGASRAGAAPRRRRSRGAAGLAVDEPGGSAPGRSSSKSLGAAGRCSSASRPAIQPSSRGEGGCRQRRRRPPPGRRQPEIQPAQAGALAADRQQLDVAPRLAAPAEQLPGAGGGEVQPRRRPRAAARRRPRPARLDQPAGARGEGERRVAGEVEHGRRGRHGRRKRIDRTDRIGRIGRIGAAIAAIGLGHGLAHSARISRA